MRKSPASRTLVRFAARTAVIGSLFAALLLTVICWRIHSSNASEDRAAFRDQPGPLAGQRIVIFSPHCDDEVLGAGGFIRAAVEAGADVRIVMLTNGDGFEFAAAWHYKQIRITPTLLRSFAYARQREAVRADGELGIPPGHITFLGFPDKGLAALWNTNWRADHPYYSSYTGCDHVPYQNAPHPGQAYCGASVLSDIETCLDRFQPDLVLMPHPNDDHPDHWATSIFVRAALSDLAARGAPWASRIRWRFFMVHHGDWPVPQGYHPAVRLAPPYSLARIDTRWSQFILTPEEEKVKRSAILQYRSQEAVMARFLESFIRRTECFGVIGPAVLTLQPSSPESAGARLSAFDGDSQGKSDSDPAAPGSRPPVLIQESPLSDTVLKTVEPGGNIQAIDARQEGSGVVLRVTLRGRVSPRVAYSLRLQGIASGGRTVQRWYARVRGHRAETDIPGGRAWASGRSLQVQIPEADLLPGGDWFVSADTRLPYVALDRAGWREFHLRVQESAISPGAVSERGISPGAVSERGSTRTGVSSGVS